MSDELFPEQFPTTSKFRDASLASAKFHMRHFSSFSRQAAILYETQRKCVCRQLLINSPDIGSPRSTCFVWVPASLCHNWLYTSTSHNIQHDTNSSEHRKRNVKLAVGRYTMQNFQIYKYIIIIYTLLHNLKSNMNRIITHYTDNQHYKITYQYIWSLSLSLQGCH